MVGLSSPDRGARGRLRAPGLRRAAILLLCLPAAASAAERGATRDGALPERREAEQVRLERIRSEIEDLRQRLARTESTAGSVLDAIEELDLRMALLAREAESLREEAHAGEPERLGGIAEAVAREVGRRTGKETRSLVLGHLQRGGSPTTFDRLLALRFGSAAVRAIAANDFGCCVVYNPPNVGRVPLAGIIGKPKVVPVDSGIIMTARNLGICLGD